MRELGSGMGMRHTHETHTQVTQRAQGMGKFRLPPTSAYLANRTEITAEILVQID